MLALSQLFLCHVSTVEDWSSFAFHPIGIAVRLLELQFCGEIALDHGIAGTVIVLHHCGLSTVVQVDLLRIYTISCLIDSQMDCRG